MDLRIAFTLSEGYFSHKKRNYGAWKGLENNRKYCQNEIRLTSQIACAEVFHQTQ